MTIINESVNLIFIYELYLLLKTKKGVCSYCTQILTNLVLVACSVAKRMVLNCLVTSYWFSVIKAILNRLNRK